MSKLAKKVIWWSDVPEASVYAIRITPEGTPFDYAISPLALPPEVPGQAEQEFDLATIWTGIPKGNYSIFVTAIDAAGNESDPFALPVTALNFTAPAAPTSGGFR